MSDKRNDNNKHDDINEFFAQFDQATVDQNRRKQSDSSSADAAGRSADERATLELRGLYEKYGYKKYKISKFEEYSLYATNRDFFTGDKVLTFTDLDGRLLAMKPR